MKRRLFALMIALVLIVSFAVPAFAAERGSGLGDITITFYAASGHAFLSLANGTQIELQINSHTVAPGEVITLGANLAYVGINYELTTLRANPAAFGSAGSIASIWGNIEITTMSQIDNIENTINSAIWNYGSYDLGSNNCIHFAKGIWNSFFSGSMRITFNPTIDLSDPNVSAAQLFRNFKNSIAHFSTYMTGRPLPT